MDVPGLVVGHLPPRDCLQEQWALEREQKTAQSLGDPDNAQDGHLAGARQPTPGNNPRSTIRSRTHHHQNGVGDPFQTNRRKTLRSDPPA